jgi:hypothetical protein
MNPDKEAVSMVMEKAEAIEAKIIIKSKDILIIILPENFFLCIDDLRQ